MSMARALPFLIAATALAACASGRLSPDPPAGVTLGGVWKLNRSASDDPQKVLDQLRAEAMKHAPRRGPMNPRRGGPYGPGGDEQQDDGLGGNDSGTTSADGGPPRGGRIAYRGDPLQHSPVMHVLMSNLTRGDFLTIRQSPEQMVFDYGGSVRRFTPGGHSVVSAEGGVADQRSGWKGKEYVIDIRAQVGPDSTERYGLSDDRKHLVVKLHIGGGDLGKVDLTRVYDPTDEIAPRVLPSND